MFALLLDGTPRWASRDALDAAGRGCRHAGYQCRPAESCASGDGRRAARPFEHVAALWDEAVVPLEGRARGTWPRVRQAVGHFHSDAPWFQGQTGNSRTHLQTSPTKGTLPHTRAQHWAGERPRCASVACRRPADSDVRVVVSPYRGGSACGSRMVFSFQVRAGIFHHSFHVTGSPIMTGTVSLTSTVMRVRSGARPWRSFGSKKVSRTS
jgi:hypothetical protein